MAERISAVLTDEMRLAILKLKYETPDTEKIMGVEYYQAVIQDGYVVIRNLRNGEDCTRWWVWWNGCLRQMVASGKGVWLINLVVRFPVPNEWLR